MYRPFLPHLLMHSVNSQVIITINICLDSQRRQLSHDVLPLLVLFSGLRQQESQAQLRQDEFSPQLLPDAHQNEHKKCLPEVDAPLQKGIISWKQNQNLCI